MFLGHVLFGGLGVIGQIFCQHSEGNNDEECNQIALRGSRSRQVDDAGAGLRLDWLGDWGSGADDRAGLALNGIRHLLLQLNQWALHFPLCSQISGTLLIQSLQREPLSITE